VVQVTISQGQDVGPLAHLPSDHFGLIYADPATRFQTRSTKGMGRSAEQHYNTMTWPELFSLAKDIKRVAAGNSVFLCWTTWPHLLNSLRFIKLCGFTYKTAGFDWLKADGTTIDLFDDQITADMKMGYWTRSNGEPCLLATRGKPKRLNADVRMGIIEKARQHSRKPDCVYPRIERLVAGPYLELFARTARPNWTSWGNQVGKFGVAA
jgi:N6-adenosine-specific RNA methylase IME4